MYCPLDSVPSSLGEDWPPGKNEEGNRSTRRRKWVYDLKSDLVIRIA